MDEYEPDLLIRHPVRRHRLTVTDYHRLGQAGVLSENDRIELLDGQLVEMSPVGPRHAIVVDRLMHMLVAAVGGRGYVRCQNPVTLDNASEPEPDIAVVKPGWVGYPNCHPGPTDIFLLIEVADRSRGSDSGAKAEIYARSGIPDQWIVDLTTNVLTVHRTPAGPTYQSIATLSSPAILDIDRLPGVSIEVQSVFV